MDHRLWGPKKKIKTIYHILNTMKKPYPIVSFEKKTNFYNVISEWPGSIVEDKNEEIKRLL